MNWAAKYLIKQALSAPIQPGSLGSQVGGVGAIEAAERLANPTASASVGAVGGLSRAPGQAPGITSGTQYNPYVDFQKAPGIGATLEGVLGGLLGLLFLAGGAKSLWGWLRGKKPPIPVPPGQKTPGAPPTQPRPPGGRGKPPTPKPPTGKPPQTPPGPSGRPPGGRGRPPLPKPPTPKLPIPPGTTPKPMIPKLPVSPTGFLAKVAPFLKGLPYIGTAITVGETAAYGGNKALDWNEARMLRNQQAASASAIQKRYDEMASGKYGPQAQSKELARRQRSGG